MSRLSHRWLLVGFLLLLIATLYYLDIGHYLTLETLKLQQANIQAYQQANPLQSALLFFGFYVVLVAISFPGATLLTLLGGAIFGFFWGFIIISFASTLGATLAFLSSRFVLRDWVEQRFSQRVETINQGINKDGIFYLFSLRLMPAIPFFAVNLLMGLTHLKTRTYFWVSQLGMLPGTLIYVNAGTELGKLESLSGIFSPNLILAFVLLSLFPWLARGLHARLQRHRVYQNWTPPKKFDYNLIVIGGGAAGLVTSYIAAALKAKVVLIEKHRMGGDCLNTGCVPSKALIRSTRLIAQAKRANEFGFKKIEIEFTFSDIMARVKRVIKAIEPHDSVERYEKLGVECLQGEARFISPWAVEVNGAILTAKNIVIATGARPAMPDIKGLEQVPYYTSNTIWDIAACPARLLVIGGGPIACELAQCFARLGSQTTIVQRAECLLPREDKEFSAMLHTAFQAEGIDVHLDCQPAYFAREKTATVLYYQQAGTTHRLVFDAVLLAVGRQPNVENLGLDVIGLEQLSVNAALQTRFPNIYACGDVVSQYQFTHAAAHQAWHAAVNALFGQFKQFKVNERFIPCATFCEPEIARVGLNEQAAQAQGVAYEVSRYDIADLDRAITDENAYGQIKVLTVPNKDTILGVTIAGEQAGELIAEYTQAMQQGLGLNKILSTIHIYPTLMEANKYVAGQWKRAHQPTKIMGWLAAYQRWRRT